MRRRLKRGLSELNAIAEEPVPEPGGTVTAEYPGYAWHVDLTVVPTDSVFWVPWLPFAMAQRWSFGWWVAVVVDR